MFDKFCHNYSIPCTVVDCKKGHSSMTPTKTLFNHPKTPGHALGKAGTKARKACTAAKRTSISWLNASPAGIKGWKGTQENSMSFEDFKLSGSQDIHSRLKRHLLRSILTTFICAGCPEDEAPGCRIAAIIGILESSPPRLAPIVMENLLSISPSRGQWEKQRKK